MECVKLKPDGPQIVHLLAKQISFRKRGCERTKKISRFRGLFGLLIPRKQSGSPVTERIPVTDQPQQSEG